MMMMMMMWTYFSSVLLQRHGPPLRVFDLEGVEVCRFSGLGQLCLQQEQAAHSHSHAQQHRQPLSLRAGAPGRVAP